MGGDVNFGAIVGTDDNAVFRRLFVISGGDERRVQIGVHERSVAGVDDDAFALPVSMMEKAIVVATQIVFRSTITGEFVFEIQRSRFHQVSDVSGVIIGATSVRSVSSGRRRSIQFGVGRPRDGVVRRSRTLLTRRSRTGKGSIFFRFRSR